MLWCRSSGDSLIRSQGDALSNHKKDNQMSLNIKTVDNFPQISRSGRTTAELQEIIDTLLNSQATGQTYVIENVEPGKKFNSLQQRIRTQAKKLDIRVMIHFDRVSGKLYYTCPQMAESNAVVMAKDVKSVKTNVKSKS